MRHFLGSVGVGGCVRDQFFTRRRGGGQLGWTNLGGTAPPGGQTWGGPPPPCPPLPTPLIRVTV